MAGGSILGEQPGVSFDAGAQFLKKHDIAAPATRIRRRNGIGEARREMLREVFGHMLAMRQRPDERTEGEDRRVVHSALMS